MVEVILACKPIKSVGFFRVIYSLICWLKFPNLSQRPLQWNDFKGNQHDPLLHFLDPEDLAAFVADDQVLVILENQGFGLTGFA